MTVYDSLATRTRSAPTSSKTATGTWNVYGAADGTPFAAPRLGTLSFTASDGTLNATASTLPLNVSARAHQRARRRRSTFTLDFTGTTQFGSAFGVNTLTQDGYAPGRLSGFGVGADGIMTGRYSNGQSRTLGQVVLASFPQPEGPAAAGQQRLGATRRPRATPIVGAPGTGNLGVLQAGALEESNVDLTGELVNMITAQRVYQANAQTIKTQDQMLQTLVNLR